MLLSRGSLSEQASIELRLWCNKHRNLMTPSKSRYAQGRWELWIRRKTDLRRNASVVEGYRNERIEALGERILPHFDIGLLLLYPRGVEIRWHQDHRIFQPIAVSVNLGDAKFGILPKIEKHQKPQFFEVGNGDIIKFNCKLEHCIEPVSKERWAVIFWNLTGDALTPSLF